MFLLFPVLLVLPHSPLSYPTSSISGQGYPGLRKQKKDADSDFIMIMQNWTQWKPHSERDRGTAREAYTEPTMEKTKRPRVRGGWKGGSGERGRENGKEAERRGERRRGEEERKKV